MKNVLYIILFLPTVIYAQSGIKFDQSSGWADVQLKAKMENKYIFVDCFATWCGPCKAMDANVYSKDTVGIAMKDKYLSVRLQMDSSKNDGQLTQKWYADAFEIGKKYNVVAFPTFLFFSPDGKLVHRAEGYKSIHDFVTLINEVTDPNKQFYTLLENYQIGKKDYATLPWLANTAKVLKKEDLAMSIANDYINNYLIKLSRKTIINKQNILFISSFIRSSKDKAFILFYPNNDDVDSVMGKKGYSRAIVNRIILIEEVSPVLAIADKNGDQPDWNKLFKSIKKRFGTDYVDENILEARVRWYSFNAKKYNRNWFEYASYAIKQVERRGRDTTGWFGDFTINNLIWDVIFLHSTDREQLDTGIKWMEDILRRTNFKDAGYVDTYANLLYKIGKKEKAIEMETKAVSLSPKNEEFQTALDLMKRDRPTWLK